MREVTQGVPLVTSSKMSFLFFLKVITLYFYVLLKFYFTREDTQGAPLVTTSKMCFV
jgi:hypothetical protein